MMQRLKAELGPSCRRLKFKLVRREGKESAAQLTRFLAYVHSLPENHRQVWRNVWSKG
jgi:hypothetical protein